MNPSAVSMAASRDTMLAGVDLEKEIVCRVCKEKTTLCILTCGHKCCCLCISE